MTVRLRRSRGAMTLVVAAALLTPALATGSFELSATAARTVHVRGTAYEFNRVHTLLAGATVHVAEFPHETAVVRPNGTYDLTVPDRSSVTPYIVAMGHHTIYLQTFRTAGEDLANVNFQTPSDAIYRGLVGLLHVPVDANGDPIACAIVSTFSTRNVRDLDYPQFIAYGAHGVPGAIATSTPALPNPTYFNANVLPDPKQAVSSQDGGVVWTGVPTGIYTLRAHRSGDRFASFVASCRPGRVVNANPPWGLHELGLPNPVRITARWAQDGSRFMLRSLTARRLPAGAVIRVSCAGARCPFGARAVTPTHAALDLRRKLGKASQRLRAGNIVAVCITAHRVNGTLVRWSLVAGHAPSPLRLCVPLGNTGPAHRC